MDQLHLIKTTDKKSIVGFFWSLVRHNTPTRWLGQDTRRGTCLVTWRGGKKGNVGMKLCQSEVCVCMLSVLKMLPSGAPHLLGHSPRHRDTVAIHHLRLQAQPGEHWPLIGQSASLSLLIGCPGLAALVWSGPDLSG